MESISYTGCVRFLADWNIVQDFRDFGKNEIGIFAISTYNTDYVLTKKENFQRALDILKDAGYKIIE